MRPARNAKIVATLGPASGEVSKIRALVNAGADVFRLNFSHGEYAEHRQRLDNIRAVEAELEHPIGVMLDLQGPKLRVGTFTEDEVELVAGQKFRLDLDPTPGDARRAHLPHPEILKVLEPGASSEASIT